MPSTEDIHSICMSPFNKLPTRLREETDLDRLDEDPVCGVSETLQPEHVCFLLRPAQDPQPESQRCHSRPLLVV